MDSVKKQINNALLDRNMTLTALHKCLKEKYGKTYSLQNLSSKINRNTLKYSEVQEIADVLNCKIIWINKDTKEEI